MNWRSKTHLFPVITPKDCVVAFAIPTSLSRFDADYAERKGYAWLFGSRASYKALLLPEIRKFVRRVAPLGTLLVHNLTFETRYCLAESPPAPIRHRLAERTKRRLKGRILERAAFVAGLGDEVNGADLDRMMASCQLTRYDQLFSLGKVVILFSHWEEDAERSRVEFAEAMVECSKVVDATPLEFPGLIDLAICHPKTLVCGIREKFRGRAHTRSIPDRERNPVIQLGFYAALLTQLSSKRQSYEEALASVTETLVQALETRGKGRRRK